MRHLSSRRRAVAAASVAALSALLWTGCIDQSQDSILGPDPGLEGLQVSPDIEGAITAQQRHTPALLGMSGVVGTAVARSAEGEPTVILYLESAGSAVYPSQLDGIPVRTVVSGRLTAIAERTAKERPAPIGFSVGHPDITAGTFGTRVKNGDGNVFILSNNHVLANSNDAQIGDPTLQPGAYDGGTLADQIGTLAAFNPIDFSSNGYNVMDAAITATTVANAGNSTPSDEGYGIPNSKIFGDANDDGLFDNEGALLGIGVQKYGRTTGHTEGSITGINGTFEICYEVWYVWCVKSAIFTDQLVIEPGGFSAGGDSGSLIVTDDGEKNPVALLFAGSETQTIANRIDLVLKEFGVTVDGEGAEPPAPVTDVAITDVSAPASAVEGDVVDVTVTVQNVGTEDVTDDIVVTLTDDTDAAQIGQQTIGGGLAAGAGTTLTFSWSTAGSTEGDHTLTASHDLTDDDGSNDSGSAVVTVGPAVTDIAVTSVSAPATATQGDAVSVDVTVENVGNHDAGAFDVSVSESPDGDALGSRSVVGLAAGAQATLTFTWNTDAGTSVGGHTLTATQLLADDNAGNDQASTSVTVEEPSAGIHVGDLDGTASNEGSTWSATVEITIHDGDHNPVDDVYVAGEWSPGSFLVSDECTTGELGGIGSCIMLYPSIRKRVKSVSFTVTTVSKSGDVYDANANHDPDGDSDGTTITVNKP